MKKLQLEKNKTGWQKSFLEGFSQDENGNALPWMTYPAIEFLQKFLQPKHEIFEFGCGASTLFFAKKTAKVISLETNEFWQKLIRNKLQENALRNVEIKLMTDGLTNNNYENFAKNFDHKFDVIAIDSLKRFECAKNSIAAVKQGGIIILDDSERKNYQKIFNFFDKENCLRLDFVGIAPGGLKIKNTTIFQFIIK